MNDRIWSSSSADSTRRIIYLTVYQKPKPGATIYAYLEQDPVNLWPGICSSAGNTRLIRSRSRESPTGSAIYLTFYQKPKPGATIYAYLEPDPVNLKPDPQLCRQHTTHQLFSDSSKAEARSHNLCLSWAGAGESLNADLQLCRQHKTHQLSHDSSARNHQPIKNNSQLRVKMRSSMKQK